MEELQNLTDLTEKLYQNTLLSKEEYMRLLSLAMEQEEIFFKQEKAVDFQQRSGRQGAKRPLSGLLFERARSVRDSHYGKDVYTRGLIEFTNYCRNDCYYCGIRKSNRQAERYRLTRQEILDCAGEGYELGFRTIVLQGGEDFSYSTKEMGELVAELKRRHPDCAVTLSLGEREREVYQYWYDCGADRYLLRHETATKEHYERLHPPEMSFEHRIRCLYDLKEIGYQVGAGFMVGSPWQTTEHLAGELVFLKELSPHMVGIGPFIAQKDTPFGDKPSGTLAQTLVLLAVIRLTLPKVLLPATTALGTIHPQGREFGIQAGANVVMPNLSPTSVRKKYLLYDNKICTGEESAQCRGCLESRMKSIGHRLVVSRGDCVGYRGLLT